MVFSVSISIDKIHIQEGFMKLLKMHFKNKLNIFENFEIITKKTKLFSVFLKMHPL